MFIIIIIIIKLTSMATLPLLPIHYFLNYKCQSIGFCSTYISVTGNKRAKLDFK